MSDEEKCFICGGGGDAEYLVRTYPASGNVVCHHESCLRDMMYSVSNMVVDGSLYLSMLGDGLMPLVTRIAELEARVDELASGEISPRNVRFNRLPQ